MIIKEQIAKHERCIQLLDAIKRFERRKQSKIESLNGFAGTFYPLKISLQNRIYIIELCIERLKNNYKELVNNL